MVTALLYVDDMVILLDDEETMRLGLKIPKNSVDRGESWAVQTFNSKKNGAKRTGD